MVSGQVPRRGVRVAVGLLAGVGATGITAGLGLVGTFLDVDLPLIDPSPLILLAPLVVVSAFAGAVLRGPAAAAVTAGAVVSPMVALFAINGSCPSNLFAGIGLVGFAFYALVISGPAAFVGDRIGGSSWFERNRGRGVRVLVGLGAIGVAGWIAAVAILFACR